jgi:hypothetical protein
VGTWSFGPPRRLARRRLWSFVPPRRLARRGFGRSLRLSHLLDGEFVIRPASQTRSTMLWSFAPPRKLARWGFGRSPRLTGSLDGALFVRPASQTSSTNGPKRGYGSHFGYPVPRYPIAAPEPSCNSLESGEGFLTRDQSPKCTQAH